MISKIQFDLGDDNRPVILADISHSDDVRDKIAKRFQESFEGLSSFCMVYFHRSENMSTHQMIEIEPVRSDLESLLKLRDLVNERIGLTEGTKKGF